MAKLYLINGFLGSGKTTAIANACKVLIQKQVRVAVIINDQGQHLVDTGFIRSLGIDTSEVSGACLCCNYKELESSINQLKQSYSPEVIFAEAVGSCTDLVATIAKPLGMYDTSVTTVITTFADAMLLNAMVAGKASFMNDEVRYIYQKQLTESDIIVINKADTVTAEELKTVTTFIQKEYADKVVISQDSNNLTDIKFWLGSLDTYQQHSRQSLDIDYDVYAKGEAEMAWLDEELVITTSTNNAVEKARLIMNNIISTIKDKKYFVGHVKFLLDDGASKQKVSYTASDLNEKISTLDSAVNKVLLLINARVQTQPEQLNQLVENVIAQLKRDAGTGIVVESLSYFKPAYPRPIHRIA